MQYNVSEDEDTLVFHTIIHPDVVSARRAACEKAKQELQEQESSGNRGPHEQPLLIPPLNSPTSSQPINIEPTPTTAQPPHIAPLNAPEAGPSTQHAQAPVPISLQDPGVTHPAIQEAITQISVNPPVRPNLQLLPVQYQAVLIK